MLPYPLDRDLFSGYSYQCFKQLGPGEKSYDRVRALFSWIFKKKNLGLGLLPFNVHFQKSRKLAWPFWLVRCKTWTIATWQLRLSFSWVCCHVFIWNSCWLLVVYFFNALGWNVMNIIPFTNENNYNEWHHLTSQAFNFTPYTQSLKSTPTVFSAQDR